MSKIVNALTLLCLSGISTFATAGVVSPAGGSGSHPAVAAVRDDMPDTTLYYPKSWPQQPVPVMLWANGGCRDNGLRYARFLKEVASHGYFVIAAGPAREERPTFLEEARAKAEAKHEPEARSTPVGSPDKTTVEQIINSLNLAEVFAADKNDEFYQRFDPSKVVVMGHSCGGLQALEVATDERLDGVILFNSGVINEPLKVQSTALRVQKSMLEKVHTPIAYVNGGPDDVAYFNALDDFNRLKHVPVFFAENGVGHGGTFGVPDGGSYSKVAIAWLDWLLKGDESAKQWFAGEDCVLCTDMDWQVQRKHL
ncbi:dienelactone hydrolase family protein [Alteromonas sp. NFXS44]|uniref:dienelactone hydrolase family protein n=1 Tax=Alteromonas sp. NFXS44 TaxID=2818435 RepID=UPI0032DF3A56